MPFHIQLLIIFSLLLIAYFIAVLGNANTVAKKMAWAVLCIAISFAAVFVFIGIYHDCQIGISTDWGTGGQHVSRRADSPVMFYVSIAMKLIGGLVVCAGAVFSARRSIEAKGPE